MTHAYRATVGWSGSTGAGYDRYARVHTGGAPPAAASLELSADPAFRGDARRLNPEQLLVLAAASCQLLSFLAVCARARIDVREYADEAEGVMPEGDRPHRITRIVLRPRVGVAGNPPQERLHKLAQVAHRECYIANSLTTEVVVEPVFHSAG